MRALKNLEQLLDLVTEQEKKYGHSLSPQSNFYQWRLMVRHFLSSQKKRLPGQKRRDLAILVASTFNKGQNTARKYCTMGKILGR